LTQSKVLIEFVTLRSGNPNRFRYWTAAAVAVIVSCLAVGAMDSHGQRLCRNTLLLIIGTLSFAVPVGCTLAWIIFRSDVLGRRVGLALLATLLFVPLYLQVAGWQAAFGPQGWWQMGYRPLGSPALLQGWRGAIWIHATAALPWVAFMVGLGLLLIPRSVEEAARLSGSWWRVAFSISLPLSRTTIVAATVWTAVVTAGEMTVTDVFQIRTYAEELFLGFAGDTLIIPPGAPAQLRVLPGILLVAVATGLAWLVSSYLLSDELGLTWTSPQRVPLGRWRWPVSIVVMSALGLLVGVPLFGLITKLGTVVEQVGDDRVRRWSARKALDLLVTGTRPAPIKFAEEFGWSLAIGNLASLAAVAIGGLLAWRSRTSQIAKIGAVVLLATSLALPGPLVGLGLIHLLNQRDWPWVVYLYDRTILAPCLAMTIRCLPLTLLILWHGLRSLPRDLVDAAKLDGVGPVGMVTQLIAPLRGQHFLFAWLVGLTIAIGDLATSILVLPPGITTLATRIFGLVHYGVEDQLAALCLCTIVLFAFLSTIVILVCRRLEFG
jgi:iron(III) transport system permease protein